MRFPTVWKSIPDKRIYSLVTPHAQTLEFFPARNVFAAVKRVREQDTRQPSKGVAKLAGRFTFDLWSGRYGDSARDLARAAEYGINDALVVWHSWQRWGYDYRLPDIYPPNPQFGTLEEFRELAAACKRNGTLFAPHDNYIDFYPDFEGFTYDSIVFRQNGTPYRAWFNYGREAQSYRARPDRLLPYVKRNVGLHQRGLRADRLLHRRVVVHGAVRLLDRRREIRGSAARRSGYGAACSLGFAIPSATTRRRSPRPGTTN